MLWLCGEKNNIDVKKEYFNDIIFVLSKINKLFKLILFKNLLNLNKNENI